METALRIRDLRKNKKMSQQEVADLLHVVPATVSSWETSNSVPPINHIIDLSKLFGVTSDYILGLTGSMENQLCTQETCTHLKEKLEMCESRIKDKEMLIDFLMRQLDLVKKGNKNGSGKTTGDSH